MNIHNKLIQGKLLVGMTFLLFGFGSSHAQDFVRATSRGADFGKTSIDAYTPEIRENMKQLYHDKIGLFVHFGPYAQLEGMWEGKRVSAEWIMKRAPISIPDYEREAARKLNPVNFNAKDWVEVARKGGMNFMVVTSKHHDGFAMFDSEHPYNIVDFGPFGRDLIGELSDACNEDGMGFGVYYSQSQDWHEKGGVGNDWDYSKPTKEEFNAYFEKKVIPQVRELAAQYDDLFMFWFDTPVRLQGSQCQTLMDLIAEGQPQALVNSRLGQGYGHFDVSLDGGKFPSVNKKAWLSDLKVPWQTHGSVSGGWGYTSYAAHRDQSSTYTKRIYTLCDIVSKGGVYLLNVAPAPDGRIPKEQITTISVLGDWLKKNGESIYNADPSPYTFPPFAITSKPGKLYLHIKEADEGIVKLDGLLTKVNKAFVLTDSEKRPLEFRQSKESFELDLPSEGLEPRVTVVVLEMDEEQARVADETIRPRADGSISLPVSNCEYEIARIGYDYEKKVTVRWGENVKQGLIWTLRIEKPLGACKVFAEQTGDETLTYELSVGEQRLLLDAKGPEEMSRKEATGTITFDQPGTYTITVRPVVTTKNKDYELNGLTLVPVR